MNFEERLGELPSSHEKDSRLGDEKGHVLQLKW
jgi:hypothetical protein